MDRDSKMSPEIVQARCTAVRMAAFYVAAPFEFKFWDVVSVLFV